MIYDLTLRLDGGTLVYPGDRPPEVREVASLADGAPLSLSELSIGCHVGTHVDAPSHFLPGVAALEALPLSAFCGPTQVVDATALEGEVIPSSFVAGLALTPGEHLLIKSRNGALLRAGVFGPSYLTLAPEAAALLVARGIGSLGIDHYSLDPITSSTFDAHRILAAAGRPVFVCLDLAEVPAGRYELFALPLKLGHAEAAPVRALLVDR